REKSGEKNGALDLSTRDWRPIMNAAQQSTADAERRCLLRTLGNNVRAHFPERFNDSFHRATAEGWITDQSAFKSLAGEQTGEQAHGRARTAAIDFAIWRG